MHTSNNPRFGKAFYEYSADIYTLRTFGARYPGMYGGFVNGFRMSDKRRIQLIRRRERAAGCWAFFSQRR